MADPPDSYVTPQRVPSSAAFGGVFELSQLLIGSDEDSGPVVCVGCRTINRAAAKVCKGCDGKLPAYFAAAGDAVGPAMFSGGRPTIAEPAPTPRVKAWMNRLAPWSTVVWSGAALVLLYGAFALWYAAHSASVRRPAAPLQMSEAKPALLPVAAAAAPAPSPARTIDALNMTLHDTTVDRQTETPAIAPRSVVRPAYAQVRADLPQRSPSTSADPRTPIQRVRSGDPLAACRGLNVFARAVCMNNSCAQRSSAGHPMCMQVVQQRRVDEARRNPTMLN